MVGFSTNLRSEARQYGVRVVAICPGYLETPMHARAENVSEFVRTNDKEYLAKKHSYPSAEKVVAHLMRGVLRNRAVVVSPRIQQPFWWLHRLAPGITPRLWATIIRVIKRKEQRKAAS